MAHDGSSTQFPHVFLQYGNLIYCTAPLRKRLVNLTVNEVVEAAQRDVQDMCKQCAIFK